MYILQQESLFVFLVLIGPGHKLFRKGPVCSIKIFRDLFEEILKIIVGMSPILFCSFDYRVVNHAGLGSVGSIAEQPVASA